MFKAILIEKEDEQYKVALQELDELGFVGRVFRQHGERAEITAILQIVAVIPRVFENAGLVGDVQEIPIH